MTQEDKKLLLKDICGRLPYGVICKTKKGDGHLCSINQTIFGTEYGININPLKRDYFNDSETEEQIIKPYLRLISSMTEEEIEEATDIKRTVLIQNVGKWYKYEIPNSAFIDWLNAHHFDYSGLIEKGLALEASEGMYK